MNKGAQFSRLRPRRDTFLVAKRAVGRSYWFILQKSLKVYGYDFLMLPFDVEETICPLEIVNGDKPLSSPFKSSYRAKHHPLRMLVGTLALSSSIRPIAPITHLVPPRLQVECFRRSLAHFAVRRIQSSSISR